MVVAGWRGELGALGGLDIGFPPNHGHIQCIGLAPMHGNRDEAQRRGDDRQHGTAKDTLPILQSDIIGSAVFGRADGILLDEVDSCVAGDCSIRTYVVLIAKSFDSSDVSKHPACTGR